MTIPKLFLGPALALLITLAAGSVAPATAGAAAGFGADDTVVTGRGGLFSGEAVAVDRTRRIVVAASSRSASSSGASKVARFLPSGRPDPSFGNNGVSAALPTFQPKTIAFDERGRVLVVGSTEQPGPYHQIPGRDLAVARLLVDGTLDPTFGVGGIAAIDLGKVGENALAVSIETGGGLQLAGESGDAEDLEPDLVLVSLGPNGGLGGGPSGEGVRRLRAGGIAELTAAAYGKGGQVFIAGDRVRTASPSATLSLPRLAEFFPGGIPNRNFGHNGVAGALNGAEGFVTDLAFDARGRILLSVTTGYRFGVVRFTQQGLPDRSFGDGGVRFAGVRGSAASARGLTVDSRGRILVVGSIARLDRKVPALFAALRLRANGALDSGFGPRGFRLRRLSRGDASARAVVRYGRGAIAVGQAGGTPSRLPSLVLARYP